MLEKPGTDRWPMRFPQNFSEQTVFVKNRVKKGKRLIWILRKLEQNFAQIRTKIYSIFFFKKKRKNQKT